ncbi:MULTISPECIES: TetR/AcrR family transcriptional regulator [Streptomyces]|uniref:TetR family transcriptional regulator n=1 Tax=Streptomyces morookaense TaxID=1970 RepID=A0A7Y7E9K9_STRMO|nr:MULTISPECIES: TetR/AcrR family transcriptional regulator [Streptomyces]MCC2279184.1 TetR family transcriptional regulator [Streptomyces sp. ET3-23]NVK81195.1 TetR family transcriptional regulator [Streptomyces morookaense]GHF30656.1 TetR family transcriptional regulator [Streptomyces morookaense]
MAENLTREQVLETAARLVRERGPRALTMRALAAELGTAVTSIYWHVGRREALVDALVERTLHEFAAIRPAGRTPRTRIVSIARALRRELLARPHLIAMVHERGLSERMFRPAQRALVHEVHAAGLRGARAAEAVQAVQFQVVGHVLVERSRERAPEQRAPDAVPGSGGDRALERALARQPDAERVFEVAVRALVEGLLPR